MEGNSTASPPGVQSWHGATQARAAGAVPASPAQGAGLVLLVQLQGLAHGLLAGREELEALGVEAVRGLVRLVLAGAEGVLLLPLGVVQREGETEVADDEAAFLRSGGHADAHS